MPRRTNNATTSLKTPPGVGISDGLGVRSSLVRKFWGDPMPCPACGYQPIQTSLLSNECRMWFRFECPNCDHQPARYRPTHGEAVEAWNKLSPHQPPTSPLETEGRPAEKSSGAGEARTPNEKLNHSASKGKI